MTEFSARDIARRGMEVDEFSAGDIARRGQKEEFSARDIARTGFTPLLEEPVPEFPTVTKPEFVGAPEVSPFVGTPGEGLEDIAGKMGLKLGVPEQVKLNVVDTLKGAAKAIGMEALATTELTLSLASGMILYLPSKAYGLMALPFGRAAADIAEEEIAKMGYQPFTKRGREAAEMVGKGFEWFLSPAHNVGEMVSKLSPELGYIAEFGAEMAEFITTGGIVKGIGGKLKARQAAKLTEAKKTLETDTIAVKEKAIEGIPDEVMRKAQERVLEVQKRQVELEATKAEEAAIKLDLKEKGETVKAAKAEVKMFITKAEEAALRERGYTQDQINKMKPVEAAEILAKVPEKVEIIQKPTYEAIEPMPTHPEDIADFEPGRIVDPLRKEMLDKLKKDRPDISDVKAIEIVDEAIRKTEEFIPVTELDRPVRELEPAGKVYPPQEFPKPKPGDPYKSLADRLGEKHDAVYLGQDEAVVVKAGEKPRLLWSLKGDNRVFGTKGLNITELRMKTDLLKEQAKPEPIAELDYQTGTPTPPIIEGESNPFFQNPTEAEGFRKLYEGRKSVTEDVEVFTQKVINDVNLAYHKGDEAAMGKARDALSQLAVRADEFRGDFITGIDHMTWKETVSDAAEWARGLRISEIKPDVIVAAALKLKNDKIVSGEIHADAFGDLTKAEQDMIADSGFITESGRYVSETEAKGLFGTTEMNAVTGKDVNVGLRLEIQRRPEGPKLYTGLPLDEMGKNIIKMADKAIAAGKKAREFRKFKPLEAIKLLNEKYKRNWVDRHGNIRLDFLRKLDDEGYRIIQRMYLTKGADPLSTMELHQMRKEISSGLTRNERRIRDDVVFNTRMADIAKYKLPKDFQFPEGSKPLESAAYLELWAQREGVTPDRAVKIQNSVDGYFEWMKKKLYEMEEEGLISAAERKDLETHKFSKIKLVDILDKENKLTIGGKVRTIHDSGIESLAKGRETDILERSSEVLALEHFERINGRILHNRANTLLKELAEKDSKNPFVRVRKPNEGIPKGWQKIYVYEEGVRETLHISPELAKEWTTSNPEITYKMGQHLKWISGSPMLKMFATGIEWAFALRNVPRDVMHIYYAARVFENSKWKSVYSPHFPVFLPQISLDIARVFKDVVTKGPHLQAYYGRGGGMEFLTSQGLVLRRGRKLDSNVSKAQKALSRFGEISELTTRRAIEEHVMRKRAKEKGIPIEEARKDRAIMDEATFAAIDYMHFSQGGGIAKAIDNGIPYLNARIQASRGLWRVAKENPTMFVYKTAQLGALTTLLYSAMRSQAPKTTEALQGSADLQNNYCIPVGDDFSFVDEKGQTRYWGFKIPCDPAQKFFKAVFEGSYDMWAGYDVDVDRITRNIAELSPVESAPLFPTITAALEYTYNKDFWKDRDAWTRSKPFPWSTRDEEGKWIGSSMEFIPGWTPQALIDIGEVTRFSPERGKTAMGELVTENSTWMYLLGKGYDELFVDVPKEEKQKQWQMVLKEFPITSSFIFVTNPYSKYAEGIEEDINIVTLKRLNERTELDRLTDGYLFTKSVERGEVMSYIRSFRDPRTNERLQDRFDFQYSIRNLPERSFWLRLQHLDPEVRARQYYEESQKPDRAEILAAGRRVIGAAGGFFSDSFYDELNKIRRANEGEE